jgi:hypothetical protein
MKGHDGMRASERERLQTGKYVQAVPTEMPVSMLLFWAYNKDS